jgi:hypothetical protein
MAFIKSFLALKAAYTYLTIYLAYISPYSIENTMNSILFETILIHQMMRIIRQ